MLSPREKGISRRGWISAWKKKVVVDNCVSMKRSVVSFIILDLYSRNFNSKDSKDNACLYASSSHRNFTCGRKKQYILTLKEMD